MNFLFNFKKLTPRQASLKSYMRTHWGVSPKDISWYEKALRHKSVVGAGEFCHNDCNERLELLGDAVLDTVITEHLFYRYPDANEGMLTKVRAKIVNRQTLGKVGDKARLGDVIEARIGNEDSKENIIGNALEALLGAIYLDQGFSTLKKSIENHLLKKYLSIDNAVKDAADYKSQLIEWAQRERLMFEFKTVAIDSENQGFQCEVIIDSMTKAISKERSKKRAEKEAAKLAWKNLGFD